MKRFLAGFAIGLLTFWFANVVWHFVASSPAGRSERILVYGFPFAVWVEGALPRIDGELGVSALCGDIVIALLCGALVGILYLKGARRGIVGYPRDIPPP